MKYPIHNYVQSHRDEIIDMLKELVKIPSVQSAPEEGRRSAGHVRRFWNT